MNKEDLILQGYTVVEGIRPYLAIVRVPKSVLEKEVVWKRFVEGYSNCYITKLFIVEDRLFKLEDILNAVKNKYDFLEEQIIYDEYLPLKLNEIVLAKIYQEKFNIDILCNYNKGVLQTVVLNQLEEFQYAFYIKLGETIQMKKEYSIENYIEYKLDEVREHKVIIFIKTLYGKLIYSKDIEQKNENLECFFIKDKCKKIYIHGSCVSRDIFNFGETSIFRLKGYAARQSLFSVLSNPLEEIESLKVNLKSNFQKRMVVNDCKKYIWNEMEQCGAEYLIIDFIDTIRFPIYLRNESKITGSTEAIESGIINLLEFERIDITILEKQWEEYLNQYIEKVLCYFNEQNIIIHCAYFKYFYRDKKGRIRYFNIKDIAKYRRMNKKLKYLYSKLQEKIPRACYINICSRLTVLADANHHFGLSPVHYTEKYYLEVKKRIEAIGR